MRTKNIQKITVLGVMTALSVVLISIIHFPIFPAVPYLAYDPGDIPIFICTYLYGPLYGLVMTFVASIIQGITVSADGGWVGVVMHIFATGSYVLAAGLVFKIKKYKIKKTTFSIILSSVLGIVAMTLTMCLWNLVFTPIYNHMSVEMVIGIMPYIIAFNLIKSGANTLLALTLYKILENVVPIFKKSEI